MKLQTPAAVGVLAIFADFLSGYVLQRLDTMCSAAKYLLLLLLSPRRADCASDAASQLIVCSAHFVLCYPDSYFVSRHFFLETFCTQVSLAILSSHFAFLVLTVAIASLGIERRPSSGGASFQICFNSQNLQKSTS